MPRELTFEVAERIDASGAVLTPLDEDEVAALAAGLAARGIEAVAVCLLHAYANPRARAPHGEIAARLSRPCS